MVRWYWVNFHCRGVHLIWIIVGQGSTVLAVGADRGCLNIFSLVCHFFPLSPSLWETARYRLKYCLKGSLNPKKPTNLVSSPKSTVFDITYRNSFSRNLDSQTSTYSPVIQFRIKYEKNRLRCSLCNEFQFGKLTTNRSFTSRFLSL